MIRTDRRTLTIVGAVVLVVGSVALALHFGVGGKDSGQNLVGLADRSAASATSEDTEGSAAWALGDYRVVTERNMFKPLVSPPQDNVSLNVPAGIPSATSRGPSSPPKPRDPTADLAMTGVVESDNRLRALIKNINTGASVYAGVGETAFGLRVTSIRAKRVMVAQADETYVLAMGAKEIPQDDAGSGAAASSAATAAAAGAGEAQRPGRPGFGPPGDMMRRLDQYRGRMTSEQYQRARRYLEERSRRGSSGGRPSGGGRPGGGRPGGGRGR